MAAVVALLASCQSEDIDNTVGNGEEQLAQINLNLGKYGTRAGTPDGNQNPYTGVAAVNPANQLNVFQVLGSSLNPAGELRPLDGTSPNLTATAKVSGSATALYLELNPDGSPHPDTEFPGGAITLGSNVNTRQGGGNEAVVRIDNWDGADPIEGTDTKTVTASLTPEMARVEITGWPTNDPDGNKLKVLEDNEVASVDLESFAIMGIYINNTRLDRNSNDLIKTAESGWNEAYAERTAGNAATPPTKYALYESYGTAADGETISFIQGPSNTGPKNHITMSEISKIVARTKSLGFNIFPQALDPIANKDAAKLVHPHIVVKVKAKRLTSKPGETPAYEPSASVFYLNIIALNSNHTGTGTDTYPAIARGNVYHFSVLDLVRLIVDSGTTLTPTPDPDDANVTINVTVSEWNRVQVAPEI